MNLKQAIIDVDALSIGNRKELYAAAIIAQAIECQAAAISKLAKSLDDVVFALDLIAKAQDGIRAKT